MRVDLTKRLEALETAVLRGSGFIDADRIVQQLLMLRDADLDTEAGLEAALAEIERRNSMTPTERLAAFAFERDEPPEQPEEDVPVVSIQRIHRDENGDPL